MEQHKSPPCIQADKGRKHSPWTGERIRKKKKADERDEHSLCMISDENEEYNNVCDGESSLVLLTSDSPDSLSLSSHKPPLSVRT